jgi:hypothetical protein
MTDKPDAGGWKFDHDKPPVDLLDPYALEQIALVLEFGRRKYAAHNWRKGIGFTRLLAAAIRHAFALLRGEDLDPESGLPHAAHLGCCAMFLIWMMENRPDLDDRWKPANDNTAP